MILGRCVSWAPCSYTYEHFLAMPTSLPGAPIATAAAQFPKNHFVQEWGGFIEVEYWDWRMFASRSKKKASIIQNKTLSVRQMDIRASLWRSPILSACLSQPVVTVVQEVTATLSRTDSTHTRGSRPNSLRLKRIIVSCTKSSHLPLAMSYTASLTTLGTCTPSLSLTQSSSPGSC